MFDEINTHLYNSVVPRIGESEKSNITKVSKHQITLEFPHKVKMFNKNK